MKWAVVRKKERDFEDTLQEREHRQALKGLLWKAVVQGAGLSVVALLVGVALLGEEPGANAYSGLFLILAGIALSQLRRSTSG